MIILRPGNERGHANHGWLDSYHTFSFANYYDPKHMGFRDLRVINEDWIQPSGGFGAHSHRDMEIITYVLEGALEHKDSLGTGAIIKPGDAQRMSAGTGITHSEFNNSATEAVHLLQIWILPDTNQIEPSYEQRNFPIEEKLGKLRLIAAKDGREGAVKIHQDVDLYTSVLRKGDRVVHHLQPNRYAWLQVASGEIQVNDRHLKAGDAISASDLESLHIGTDAEAEILLFDLV
jgi:quercetin 2,3-dioxygenase